VLAVADRPRADTSVPAPEVVMAPAPAFRVTVLAAPAVSRALTAMLCEDRSMLPLTVSGPLTVMLSLPAPVVTFRLVMP